ncbi:MAG: DNA-3-methyladenine glycosylase [Rhodospirillales bacterium]|nr:DNA-3-methyladenine glycosylase [Rhodospirillales bacterium]
MSGRAILQRDALAGNAVALAPGLIGCTLLRVLADGQHIGGRIVEVEAYEPDDPASHAFRGRTPRNASMFARPGTAYVYRAYGTSWMLNVATGPVGHGAAVLIRAIAPEIGVAAMAAARPGATPRDLARGPGRLAAALHIDRGLDGCDLCAPGALMLLAPDPRAALPIAAGLRIGITKGVEYPHRFFVAAPHALARAVSGKAALNVAGLPLNR